MLELREHVTHRAALAGHAMAAGHSPHSARTRDAEEARELVLLAVHGSLRNNPIGTALVVWDRAGGSAGAGRQKTAQDNMYMHMYMHMHM